MINEDMDINQGKLVLGYRTGFLMTVFYITAY